MIVPDLRKFLTSGSHKKPVLVVLAGPNGAGKTTFFELFIAPSDLPFVNADFIAKELADKGKPVSPNVRQPSEGNSFRRSRLSVRQQFLRRTVSAGRDVRGRRTPPTVSAAPALGAFHTA